VKLVEASEAPPAKRGPYRRAIEDFGAVWRSNPIRKRNPVDCVVVVSNDEGELFRVPFVEAPGVLTEKN